jgi:restriction endonuclease Mrr
VLLRNSVGLVMVASMVSLTKTDLASTECISKQSGTMQAPWWANLRCKASSGASSVLARRRASSQATDYVRHLRERVILIDGQRLAELMSEHNVGVRVSRTVEFKRVDEDFFSEDE